MTMTLSPTLQRTDADLVAASRSGDREAFGAIVRRYQAMISGLIYAACGDLHRSEDLAQETFVSAWKSLTGLKDPAKLAGWLCQIARHRLTDRTRSAARETLRLRGLWSSRPAAGNGGPSQEAIDAEERELLWRALAEIPQPYRETLVLYYRQGESASAVAAAMETTEPAVRKRLERGREMLREEMSGVLERQLRRTAPRPEFASAVLAALPAAAFSSKAATAGTLAKGSSWLAVPMGMVAGFAGAFVVMVHSFKGAATRREGVIMGVFWLAFWAVVAATACFARVLFSWRAQAGWSDGQFVLIQSAYWCAYGVAIFSVLFAMGAWRAGYRRRSGLPIEPPEPTPLAGLVLVASATVGGLGWAIEMSWRFGDTVGAWGVAVIIVLLTGFLYLIGRRAPAQGMRGSSRLLVLLVLVLALILDWRLRTWVALARQTTPAEVARTLPLWPINVFALVLMAYVAGAATWVRRVSRR